MVTINFHLFTPKKGMDLKLTLLCSNIKMNKINYRSHLMSLFKHALEGQIYEAYLYGYIEFFHALKFCNVYEILKEENFVI